MDMVFPYLLLPHYWASRNRVRRGEKGDLLRGLVFGSIGVVVFGALYYGAFWVTSQLAAYEEFGDYLLRLGLSWLFLTLLAFLAFSGVVTSLSTFFLSDDLRLLMVSPVAARRLFLARFLRTVGSASWMIVIFIAPVLIGAGVGRCAPPAFYATAVATVVPFAVIPVALGSACTLLVVNVFPARRARDILALVAILGAALVIAVFRLLRPEKLARPEGYRDLVDFIAALQTPQSVWLPSEWAAKAMLTPLQLTGPQGDLFPLLLLASTAAAALVIGAWAHERLFLPGLSRAHEGAEREAKGRNRWRAERWLVGLPITPRSLVAKDIRTFFRDTTQWSQLVLLLRFIQPERLMRVDSLPDITDFFATLQSPVTPLLPSFWAGESLFASVQGGFDWLHQGALWTTAGAFTILLGAAHERWHFAGYSRSQEAPKTRFARFQALDVLAAALPLSAVRRQLLVKDVKVFLRDVSQWVQLLPLLALVLLYLYNFRVLDLERIPYMSGFIKNVYAFVNLGMAGFVMATVAVRFVFPSVSAEGAAFWIIRTSPISMRDFLWSKFWTSIVPVLVFTEGLTIAANELLGVDPFLKLVAAGGIVFMTFALVGLATGLGARYPRFDADPTQAAGSYGGVMFMIGAVFLILVTIGLLGWPSSIYLLSLTGRARDVLTPERQMLMAASFTAAAVVCTATWWIAMRSGVRALEAMRN